MVMDESGRSFDLKYRRPMSACCRDRKVCLTIRSSDIFYDNIRKLRLKEFRSFGVFEWFLGDTSFVYQIVP